VFNALFIAAAVVTLSIVIPEISKPGKYLLAIRNLISFLYVVVSRSFALNVKALLTDF
jgi:hypothetical protein